LELRDHPLMIRKSGVCSWPPMWRTTHHDKNDKLAGEIGTLQQVLTNEFIDRKIYIFIDYQGRRYMGVMTCDNAPFWRGIYTLLNSKLGLSIKEIGDIDLSYTL
jgi:hypothetical protein